MEGAKSLYLPDFLTGIIAALAAKKVAALSLRRSRLDRAFARLTEDVVREAQSRGISVKFRIRLHDVHQDSTQLHQALYEAAPTRAWTTRSVQFTPSSC